MSSKMEQDEYELQSTSAASDPLLPRYEQHKPSDHLSPHVRHELHKRHSRFRRAVSCVCVCLLVLVPTIALGACFLGRLERVKQRNKWESMPDEVKEWLEAFGGTHALPNTGVFPTK
jgi:hypothetical protein